MNDSKLFRRTSLVATLCYLWVCPSLRAAEILSHLPENALSFAIIRDAQATNDKIVKFVDIYREGLPAPLEMAQAMTGLSKGLNLHGDVLFALLPSAEVTGLPAPMFLLPVSDYAKFAVSVQGDATGEICRVTIAGEDVLVARLGDYALIMNLEHRELMQGVLRKQVEISSEVLRHKSWLAGNDISMMVTSTGIAHMAEVAKHHLRGGDVSSGDDIGQPALADEMLTVDEELPFSEFFKDQVKMAGLGFALDDAVNARLRWCVQFEESATEAGSPASAAAEEKPLTGYPDKPYALAGGGPLPPGLDTVLPELFLEISQGLAAQDGRGDFTEKDWADVRETYNLAFSPLRSLHVLLTPGVEREPILSVLFARLTVDDSQAYLEGLRKSIDLSNQLTARSNGDIKLNFEIAPVTIAQAEGIEVSCDFDKATGDGNNHIWQALLTSAFGVDHKWSLYFCAADEKQVFFGMESKEKLAELIEAYRKGDTGLATNSQVQKTFNLIDAKSSRITLVNPQGFVELVQTAMKSMMILGFVPQFPLYPTAPPLGLTVSGNNADWNGEIVLPVEAARAMSEFIKEVEKGLR